MRHDDYLAHYATLAKQRKYRPVKPRDPDHVLTRPVLVTLGIAALLLIMANAFGVL